MEEGLDAVKSLKYTCTLLDYSKYKDKYRCVKRTDNFVVQEDEVLVPVWGWQGWEKREEDMVFLNSKCRGVFVISHYTHQSL